jgi:hypothetical protein
MRYGTVRSWGIVATVVFLVQSGSARAGGPILFNEEDGRTFPWLNNRAVYVVETGRLGVIENAPAATMVAQAFQRWTAIPTAELRVENLDGILSPEALAPFKTDITSEDFITVPCPIPALGESPDTQRTRIECDLLTACFNQGLVNCPSPIIFDEDGSIVALVFGQDSGVLGFSGPLLFSLPGGPVEPFRTVQAFTVLNGAFFDENAQNSPFDDAQGTRFLEGVMVHEFGHFLGLGHSNVNGDTALLNPATNTVGTSRVGQPGGLASVDALTAVRADDVETMYPVNIVKDDGTSASNTVEKDDEIALSTLYPCTAEAAANQRCLQALATTGTIAGRVFIPAGDHSAPAQGVLVIARRLDTGTGPVDRDGDGLPDDPVLREAVSQLTGATFAPRRCTGVIALDFDGDNATDFTFTGVFGSCNEPTQEESTVGECADQINNNLIANFFLPAFGAQSGSFFGSCGSFSAGTSVPRPVGDEAENRFELTGLSPGQYLVQAVPVFQGGFSSPVRSSLGLVGLVGLTDPVIQSDDNVLPSFFPNPQTGEFYNGLPDGCGSSTAPCGQESGNVADNPFAFTPLMVSASGRVDHVNIFLNTSIRSIVTDPGFDFCQLGDVDGNGVVEDFRDTDGNGIPDQGDLLTVIQAKAAFDTGLSLNQRADLNKDGSITFLDLDIITDIVTLPRPFGSPGEITGLPELKRGLAPFDAICTAARDGGCQIQAPVEARQDNGNPLQEVCDIATTIGCQVVGCP